MKKEVEIETLHLFPTIDSMLVELLTGLSKEEWERPTIAKLWTVKDIASHLLDGTVRALSVSRDHYLVAPSEDIRTYRELVTYINRLNRSWTDATKRMSPEILIELLRIFNKQYTVHLRTLDPFADAIYSVAWAGDTHSPNWFHIAREYTEKFLHQQQIREAVNKQGLITSKLFYPYMDTLMRALPHTFAGVEAESGTVCSVIVTGETGGRWNVEKTSQTWVLRKGDVSSATAVISVAPDLAWKLFSRRWKTEEVRPGVDIDGDQTLAMKMLGMVSFMV